MSEQVELWKALLTGGSLITLFVFLWRKSDKFISNLVRKKDCENIHSVIKEKLDVLNKVINTPNEGIRDRLTEMANDVKWLVADRKKNGGGG